MFLLSLRSSRPSLLAWPHLAALDHTSLNIILPHLATSATFVLSSLALSTNPLPLRNALEPNAKVVESALARTLADEQRGVGVGIALGLLANLADPRRVLLGVLRWATGGGGF